MSNKKLKVRNSDSQNLSYVVYVWKSKDESFHRISYTENLKKKLIFDRKKYSKMTPLKVIYTEKGLTLSSAIKRSNFFKKNKEELINIMGKGKWKSIPSKKK